MIRAIPLTLRLRFGMSPLCSSERGRGRRCARPVGGVVAAVSLAPDATWCLRLPLHRVLFRIRRGQRCSNGSCHLEALPRCCRHADRGGSLMCVLLGGHRVGAEKTGGGRPVSRRGTTRRAAPVRVLGTFGIPAACPGATRATRCCAFLAAGAQRNVASGTRSGKGRRVVLHERRSTRRWKPQSCQAHGQPRVALLSAADPHGAGRRSSVNRQPGRPWHEGRNYYVG